MHTLEECVEEIRSNQINIQLDFSVDRDGYILFQLRALPWRNAPRQGYMMLVAGHSISEALGLLADDLAADRWTALNWKIVLNEPGRYLGHNTANRIKDSSTAPDTRLNGKSAPARALHAVEASDDD